MSVNEFWRCMKSDTSNFPKKLVFTSFLFLLTLVALCGMYWFYSGEDIRYQVTEEEVKKEQEYIQLYEQQQAEYQRKYATSAKPVTNKDVESVQNEILKQTKTYNLNVLSVNAVASAAPVQAPAQAPANSDGSVPPPPLPTGREFEMTLQGAWENTTKYLQGIEKSSALVLIRSLRIEPQQNSTELKTIVKYKIYIE